MKITASAIAIPLSVVLAACAVYGQQRRSAAADSPPGQAATKSLGDLTGPWILFVDDTTVRSTSAITRTYHAFKKYAGNPVMKGERPWEANRVYVYGTVLPGEDRTGYRMWYHGHNAKAAFGGRRGYFNAYAQSSDGIHWTKPTLGLFSWRGSSENNMFLTRRRSPGDDHHPQVIHTPWESDSPRRYKLMTFAYYDGYWASYSADGVRWRDVENNPVLVDPGDVGNFNWDAHRQRYIGYVKIWLDGVRGHKRRCVGFTHTADFESWPTSKLVLVPDRYDDRWAKGGRAHTDFYGLSAFPYESAYIGFLWVYRIGPGNHRIHVELVSSPDGVKWIRQERPRPPILRLGRPGEWDDSMLFTPNHPLVEGDTIKLFYGGFDGPHDAENPTSAVGMATLRKDGFASLDAGGDVGTVTTRLVAGAEGPLRVNADAKGGWLKAEVLDAEANVLPGYERDACTAAAAGGVNQTMRWRSRDKLPQSAGPIAIRFVMSNASLYSFTAGDRARIVREAN